MLKALPVILLLSIAVTAFPQASDFISLKKSNNRTIKTFFPGVNISFETYDKRQVNGLITAIRNDSVFVKEWDVRSMVNYMGIPVYDTVGAYLSGFHYKEINKVDVTERMHLQQATPGRILIIGGAGYALLNVINGAYLHQSITSSKNLTSLGIAAGAVATGLLVNYLVKHSNRYHVEYIRMNEIKNK